MSDTAVTQSGKTDESESLLHELRASAYELIASLLAGVPSQKLIEVLASMAPVNLNAGPIAEGWEALRVAAGKTDKRQLEQEYFALFVGLGRGELVPFGSWYLTGSLMEKPLSDLRNDLNRLGIARQEGVTETEDHIAALCGAMSLIIHSSDDITFSQQQQFYQQHLDPWIGRFFTDLQQSDKADFYRAVGLFGARFERVEKEVFNMTV